MKHPDCDVCRDLWGRYATALHRYLRIASKHQIAAYEHDYGTLSVLEGELAEAEAARDAARNAIRDHEREPHEHKQKPRL